MSIIIIINFFRDMYAKLTASDVVSATFVTFVSLQTATRESAHEGKGK